MLLFAVPGGVTADCRECTDHGRFIHIAPQEQMDTPDTSGAESMAPQAIIETRDGVFGQLFP